MLLVVVTILMGIHPVNSLAGEEEVTNMAAIDENTTQVLLTDEQVEIAYKAVMEMLDSGANDADRTKAIIDFLLRQVVQKSESTIMQEGIGELDSSYECATAFRDIARRLGLECVVVKADSYDSYWNVVHVGDAWYHTDVWEAKREINIASDDATQERTHAVWLLVGEQSLATLDANRATWKLVDDDWNLEDITVSDDDYVWERVDNSGQDSTREQIEPHVHDKLVEDNSLESQLLSIQALPNSAGGIQQVVAENTNTAAVVNGVLWAWGDNSCGQIGDGTYIDRPAPVRIMDDVAEAYFGGGNAGVLKNDGSFWIWGDNSSGQLGDGSTTGSNKPKKLMDGVRTASIGGKVVAIVKSDGTLWTLGAGTHGALGNGSTSDSNIPTMIMDNVVSVSMGGFYRGAAVKSDGTLWSWGWSYKGATLGNGSAEGASYDQTTPVRIMDNVSSVELNTFGGVAVKNDATLWIWGIEGSRALMGQYKTGDNTPRIVLSNVKSTSAANYSFAAIKTDNSLVTWGESNNGTLGNGTDDSSSYGISKILDSVSMVDMGAYHGVALTLDGRVYTWGNGSDGQLGNGDTANTSVPAEITVVDNTFGSFTGKVCDAVGRVPVQNADIIAQNENGKTFTTTTDNEGNYTITVPGGLSYRVTIDASGYIGFTYHARLEEGENAYTEAFLLVAGSSADQGTSKGTILNAKTSEPVAGVSLQFRKGWGVATGAVVAETNSGSNGSYSIALPQGNYTMSMSKNGFVTSISNVVSMAGEGFTQDAVLSPIGYDNEYRFVLTWGDSPSDLDSHLNGTLSNGSQFHVYYRYKSQGDGEVTTCSLDVDDTTSYGPETITLTPTTGKAYYYYIHRYSDEGALSSSNAQVKVYRGSSLIQTFNAPTNQGNGEYWNVCAIVCGQLVSKDTVDDSPNTEYAKDMEGPSGVYDLTQARIDFLSIPEYVGNPVEPEIAVYMPDDMMPTGVRILKKGTDYTVSFSNNTKVGTATVTIAGVNQYYGTKSATFEIKEATNSFYERNMWQFPNSSVDSNGKPAFFGLEGDDYYIMWNEYNRLKDALPKADWLRITMCDGISDTSFVNRLNPGGELRSGLYQKWGGSCEGMSVWSCLAANGTVKPSYLGNGYARLRDVPFTGGAESAINYYHVQQFTRIAQQRERAFINKSQQAQLQALDAMAAKASVDHPFRLGFSWYKDCGWWQWNGVGHTTVGYGKEVGSWTWTVGGKTDTYTSRVRIYDCSYPNGGDYEKACLYYNVSKNLWCIPMWSIRSTSNEAEKKGENNGMLSSIESDPDKLNIVDITTGRYSTNGETITTAFLESEPIYYTLTANSKSYNVDGLSVSGPDNDVVVLVDSQDGSETNSSTRTAVFTENSGDVKVSSDDSVGFSLSGQGAYRSVSAGAGGEVVFGKDGSCTVVSEERTDISILAAPNNQDIEGFDGLTITAAGSNELELTPTANGLVIEGDNLDDLTFLGFSLESANDSTRISASSNKNSVLVRQDGSGLSVFEDSDGDGSYERRVTPNSNDCSKASVSSIPNQTYTGSEFKPQPKVTLGGKTLTAGTDYVPSYKNNVNVGTATVTVTGRGNFKGTKSVTFKIAPADVAKATVSKIANQPYTGRALTPKPTVNVGGTTLKLNRDYTIEYNNNVKAGTATVTVKGAGNYKGTSLVTFRIVAPLVRYRTHVQSYGDQSWRANGQPSGTFGKSKRLEGIWIVLPTKPVSGSVQYRTHVQTYGWQGWRNAGKMSGTHGQAKRLEAIQIRLTGQMEKMYDVYYRVHAQTYGWMGWARNGAQAGTAGWAKRLEAIQIVLVPKGAKSPAANYGGYKQMTAAPFVKR